MGVTLGLLVALPRTTAGEESFTEVKVASFPTAETVSPETLVAQYADFYGVSVTLAKDIAHCESKFDPRAKNPNSTAKGLFQYIDATWRQLSIEKWGYVPDVYDPRFNAELGAWTLATYGTSPWVSSKECWQ